MLAHGEWEWKGGEAVPMIDYSNWQRPSQFLSRSTRKKMPTTCVYNNNPVAREMVASWRLCVYHQEEGRLWSL